MLLPIIAFAATTEDNEKISLTKKQRDILHALGVPESEIDNLSGAEIGKLITKGTIVDYKYLEPYLPSYAELAQDRAKAEVQLEKAAQKIGNVSADELLEYLSKTKESASYILQADSNQLEKVKNRVSEYRFKKSLTIMRAGPTNRDRYVYFTNAAIKTGYNFYSCYIHKDALDTAYAEDAGTQHYNELKTKVSSCKAIGNFIFQKKLTSAENYAYNLWGDFNEDTGKTHQGIDFTLAYGTPVYNIYQGKLVASFSQLGGTTLVIYDKVLDVNFIYMHTQGVDPAKFKIGSTIPTAEPFTKQGTYSYESTTNSHVHLEVVPSDVTTPNPDSYEVVYSDNPYIAALFYIP